MAGERGIVVIRTREGANADAGVQALEAVGEDGKPLCLPLQLKTAAVTNNCGHVTFGQGGLRWSEHYAGKFLLLTAPGLQEFHLAPAEAMGDIVGSECCFW